MSKKAYSAAICYPACLTERTVCMAGCAAEEVAHVIAEGFADLEKAMEAAFNWLAANPAFVIGGAIVIGGVILIATGGAGAPAALVWLVAA
jgi:hypothetical protein